MDNPVLDVAIGLVFIYLLYSLLATTIKEFIATIFSYRSKMLERGIEQMLDGKNYKYFWWDRLMNWADNKSGTKTDRKLYLKKNLFANKIFNHELYQRAGENVNSEKPSYLPSDVFSDILVDILNGGPANPLLLKTIEINLVNTVADPRLRQILQLYINQANGDLQKFKLLVEHWYDDMMDRVSGWYKKQANRILLYIGFCLAMAFNVNTINIIHVLSTDKAARAALLQSATTYVNGHTSTTVSYAKDSLAKSYTDTSFKFLRVQLDSIKKLFDSTISTPNTTLGLGWGDYYDSSGKDTSCFCSNNRSKSAPCKIIYVISKSVSTPQYLLGFLITAFAISLGAPFWFDLLNKFVNLRVSGAKPDAKSSTPVSKTAILNQKPDPNAKG